MKENWGCFPVDLIILNVALACINGVLAFIAFAQLMRIHMRSQQDGWTRQKVLHLMIGFSNLASPKILFLAVFLLLLSFWVDLCHQANEEEEEDNDDNSIQQALLKGVKRESGSTHMKYHWRCCSFQGIHIGGRQKYAAMVQIVVLIFVVMISFGLTIWIGIGENPINSSVVARVYEKLLAVMTLTVAAALGCYSALLYFKLRKVRSEEASSEMWKVASLAVVSIICLSSSSLVAFLTDIPLFYHWHLRITYGFKALVFLVWYYFVGSSLPSAYLLWIIRELPPQITDYEQEQPRAFTFISHGPSGVNQPRYWATETCSKNRGLRASPI